MTLFGCISGDLATISLFFNGTGGDAVDNKPLAR
jgi:hypothetical protein